jgi:hypothetical protein
MLEKLGKTSFLEDIEINWNPLTVCIIRGQNA